MRWRVLATSGVVALGCVIGIGISHESSTSGAEQRPLSREAVASHGLRNVPAVPARRVGAVRPEAPARSVLPGGQVVPIVPAGIAADGSLKVPGDIRVAGWWQGGARLGDPFGSTVLAAHVDSFTQGLGPYAGLLSVSAGQRITISSRHLTQTFAVVSLALVPRGTLSEHPRIFSQRGDRRLTLVTCAGPYDVSRGGYQNLAVVTARPVAEAATRGAR